MKLYQGLSCLFVVTSAIVACSSGGVQRVPGLQCPANHKPFAETVTETQTKIWEKQGNESAIPEGTYTYQHADLVYTQKGQNGLIIHAVDAPQRDGTFKASIYCVRNAAAINGKNIGVASAIASQIVAKVGATSVVDVKELSFKVVEGRLVGETKALPKTDSVKKVYDDAKNQSFFMIEESNKEDYEIRSSFSDNDGDYVVSVRFKKGPYVAPTATETPVVEPKPEAPAPAPVDPVL